jgi:hypothetical protein
MAPQTFDSAPDDRAMRGLRPIEAAPVLEARTRAARQQGFYVVLARQTTRPAPAVVEALCEGLGWDTWSTLQRLEAPTPRLLRRELLETHAQRWVLWLLELGLKAFIASEARMVAMRPHEVVSMSRDNQTILATASDGTLHRVSTDEALCIVCGDIRTRLQRTVQSQGKLQSEVLEDSRESFFDVHLKSGDVILRFRQSALRFSDFLQGDESGSLAQFARVREIVCQSLPGIMVFEGFEAAAGSLGDSWRLLSRSTDFVRGGFLPGGVAEVEVAEENTLPLFHLWSLLHRFQQESR